MPFESTTTEAVESALVAPVSNFDEPPIDNSAAPQVTSETLSPEGTQPEAEPQPGDEGAEGSESSAAETQEEEAIGYEDLLPARQAKTFPDEFLNLAAKRWNVSPDDLNDEQRGPAIKQLLTDKINSDIYIANQRREEAIRSQEQQQLKPEEKPPQEQEQQQVNLPTWEELSTTSSQIAQSIVTDEGAAHFGPRLYDALAGIASIRENESADPKEVAKANRALTEVMTQFGVMLLAQTSPQIVQTVLRDKSTKELITPYIEGYLDTREGSQEQEATIYSEARELLAKEPDFRDLKELGGENGPIDQAAQMYFDDTGKDIWDVQFIDRETRQPLPPIQNAMAQLRHVVKLWRGSNYQPMDQVAKNGIQRGRQLERQQSIRKDLGRLRTGKPSGQFAPTSAVDDEMSAMTQAYDQANPLSIEASSNRR